MAKEQHLDHAPISEALVDFRVELASDFDPQSFLSLKDELATPYSEVEEIHVIEGDIRVTGQSVSQSTGGSKLFGFRFGTASKDRIIQMRKNGFTYSKLRPYTSWKEVFEEAWRIWLLFVGVARPSVVTRIAVRYINHIEIPFPFEFAEFFTDPPMIPDDLPQDILTYFKRATVVDQQAHLAANIIQAVDRPDPRAARFLLDIDVYRNQSFTSDDSALKSSFSDLQAMKNRIFFGSIRDEAVRLFK